MTVRIIPRLDIKGKNLVKGIHLEGLRVLGSPDAFARYYYESGADELLYMDVVASLYGTNNLSALIERTAREIFIPLTVGGGLRNVEDVNSVLRAGADKVCLNTAAIKNPQIIRDLSEKFGSSTIVIAIEAIRQPDGRYFAFIDNGREYTGLEIIEWATRIEELGAGEILITSVDMEGTGKGFNIDLISQVTNAVNIPVIAHGGCGQKLHAKEVFDKTGADAIAVASMFHYDSLDNHRLLFEPELEGNIDFLKSGNSFKLIDEINISELKDYLVSQKVNCRN
ncbi:imidazole glycerol phosphate synthase cyclase subunit [Leptospira sp. FAT2]|uniref:imidazole glycerol phosphate synthase subunit HisF n=1 Tax=Leptospira sanjuanensis TaxID=2879643 RepID=UPI001EE96B14|nr:imidazole glycerol phosphate synthase cyclase subunit [Leptospira sanjuanensis]MCG6167603.1 imidazole glycerol phosphate synthase cyclase subunit [Leptospira sanjuanensis]MCG6193022.1 imidazole glycerol phosphate synthase cyclase subunit [Leptospira sanjuanensis]